MPWACANEAIWPATLPWRLWLSNRPSPVTASAALRMGRVGTGQRGNGGRTGDEVGSAESFQRPGDAARSTASGYRAAVVPGRRCGFRGEVFRSRFE